MERGSRSKLDELEEKSKMKSKCFIFLLVSFFLPVFSAFSQNTSEGKAADYFNAQISDADKLKVFNNLWETVNRFYFDKTFNGNDWNKLREIYRPRILSAKNKVELRQILNQIIGELDTSHLKVSFEINMSGKTLKEIFGENFDYKNNIIAFGYGFETAKFDTQTVVTKVEKKSSAENSGVKVGWIQKSCKFSPITKEVGDSLIFNENANCIFSTELDEEQTIILNQNWFLSPVSKTRRESKIIAENVLYLKFREFDKGSGKWFNQQISANSNARTIIIDLRDNFGGLRDEMRDCLSGFFPPKTVVGEFIERNSEEKNFAVGSENYYKKDVIVLINGNSYSGAEIFAAAIQDLKRGKIIGQTSGGEVLNSVSKGISNGFNLLIAIRDYKTIKGKRLEKVGVKPDLEIPFSIVDFRKNHDIILEKTLELFK